MRAPALPSRPGGAPPERAQESPRFDIAVKQNGYAWWYVDALSADGTQGLTIIAFIGSVFSPYYALARTRGRGDAENHVCMNVALYGKPRRWAMTERGRGALTRTPERLAIGASAMRWDGRALIIDIDETTVPLPSKLRGRIIVKPRSLPGQSFRLDTRGCHRWRPIAPSSDVIVEMSAPKLSWSGTGYFDMNEGDEPLEAAFQSWSWSRFDLGAGAGVHRARIFYDVVERDGVERGLSLDLTDAGIIAGTKLGYRRLPTTGWGIPRAAPCEAGHDPVLLQTMENAPFYARSAVRSRIDGIDATGVHESLSLDRVISPVVRLMLPFKMFRRA